mgnify:FL=1
MIKIVVTYRNDKIKSLVISGHANSASKGNDLICAAVSTVFQTGLEAFNEENKLNVELDNGFGKLEFKEEINKHDEIVLEVIMKQLECICRNYPQYVKLERK